MTRRILVSFLSVAAFVLLVLEVPLAVFFDQRERDRFASGVSADASVLATEYEEALEGDEPISPDVVDDYAARTGARVVVTDVDGVSVADSDAEVPRDFSTRPEVADALSGRATRGTRHSETLGADLLYVAVPIASGGEVEGVLRVTIPTADIDERVHRFWWSLGAVAATVLATTAVVGWTVARSMTRPLRELQDTAAAFGRGDLRPHDTPRRAPPEVADLSRTMNAMAADLRGQIDLQRRFVADASHQMRTPITALRLRLENVQTGPVGATDDDLRAIAGEIDRLSTLVEQLLALARADRPAELVDVDVAELARERVELWQAVADNAQVTLTATGVDRAAWAAATPAIEQVVDNLIDNSLAVSAAGAEVVVTVRRAPSTIELEVVDHGPGLDDEAKVRARERFWRAADAPPGGSGLGLAIADALVTASRGSLTLRDTPGGGLTVRVELPARDR